MSDIADIKAALAALVGAVSGVARAYAYPPRNLPLSDLPAAALFTGPGQYDSATLGRMSRIERRTFLLRLYVAPIAQGIDGELEKVVEPFLRTIPAALDGRLGLDDPDTGDPLPWVQQVTAQNDQGVSVLQYAGESFLGAEFRVEVETYVT